MFGCSFPSQFHTLHSRLKYYTAEVEVSSNQRTIPVNTDLPHPLLHNLSLF